MGADDPSHWQIHGQYKLFWGQFYYIAITDHADLKFVGTWAPNKQDLGTFLILLCYNANFPASA